MILDPSPPLRVSSDLYVLADYITPDSTEARILTGQPVQSAAEAFAAGQTLVERGVRVALVKLGSGGCVVVCAGLRARIPTASVRVVDTTGAGDAFAGALGVALLEGRALDEPATARYRSEPSVTSRHGSDLGYPIPSLRCRVRLQHRRGLAHEPTSVLPVDAIARVEDFGDDGLEVADGEVEVPLVKLPGGQIERRKKALADAGIRDGPVAAGGLNGIAQLPQRWQVARARLY